MNKDDIEPRLQALFEARHWQFRRLVKLCPAFVRDRPVTPFFRPKLARRWPGVYQIDGCVGVIHQEFESRRARPDRPAAGGRLPCLWLDIANLRPLLGLQRVHEANYEKDLAAFTDVLGGLMEAMPHDAAALHAAFESNVLLDVPFENYTVLEGRAEFEALKAFVAEEVRGRKIA